jgi:fatty acid desaturase
VGRVLGTAILVPYTVYRESHITHHAYLNTPSDWELWPYNDPLCSRRFRRVFAWGDLFFGVVTSPLIYGRIYFHRNSPLKSPEIRRTIRREYLGMALFWGTVLALVAYFGAWRGLARTWIIPASLAGVMQTWRKFTEHLGMQSYEPLLGTRTVIGPNWGTRLASFLNFEIFVHGVHHRHPRLMHENLVPKMEHYVQANPGVQFPVFRSYWHAAEDMIPYLLRNPGCGMNVGAPSPASMKREPVRDFATEVRSEIPELHEVG